MDDSESPPSGDPQIDSKAGPKRRVIRYSFWGQTGALLVKSARNQSRAIKTNICLIAFPIALSLALFGSQFVVIALTAQTPAGLWTPAIPRPAVTPALLVYPINSGDCPTATGLRIDFTRGNIVAATYNQTGVGVYSGPILDPVTERYLPSDWVDPYNGTIGSYLLGNASADLSNYYAETVLVSSRGDINGFCGSSPTFEYINMSYVYSAEDIDTTIFTEWGGKNYLAGIDFVTVNDTHVSFNVMYNYTLTSGLDVSIYTNLVSNAVWRSLFSNTKPNAYLKNPGTKDMPTPRVYNVFDIVALGAPNLYIYIFLLLLPITLENMVAEKEARLRETMRMMGLKTHVYFLATYLWNYLIYAAIVAFAIIIGCLLGFTFWLHNNFLTYFLLLFLWGHTLIAMAWLMSVFITSSRTAVVLGYAIVLAIGIICINLIRNIVLDMYTPYATLFGISVIPPLAFFRGMTIINDAIAWDGPGMRLSDMYSSGLVEIFIFLIVQWVVCITLAIYFEMVLPIGPGSKKDPLFFLPRSMWLFRTDEHKAIEQQKASLAKSKLNNAVEMDEMDDKPDDVLAEEKATLEADNLIVKSLGLHKVYTRGNKTKVAVRELTMGIRHGECFGFLGPNGAGKSTTISMLCGYLRPTSGTAIINGLSIRDDMDDIHLQMGVCPQDDALWPDLTGPEHLEFYGRLKNLSGKELNKEIDFWLEQVNLNSKKTRKKASKEYSGGMKRRLSVACAMIGNPSVVLMDEPTTGLDPASRIALWQVVRKFKSQCAMMLTTHSMDEAEALCDRLGIFVAGRLKTIGHASELKERYGRFYKIQMTTTKNNDAELLDLLKKLSPNVRLLNSLAGTNNFEVPSADIALADLFATVEGNKTQLGISNWGVSNTTLEEVFLKVTQNEVQDEALKFAKKKKKKTGCCGGSGAADEEVAVGASMKELNESPDSDEEELEGDAGFVAEPGTSERRLAQSVNEINYDEDPDSDEDTDEDEETEEEEEEEESQEEASSE